MRNLAEDVWELVYKKAEEFKHVPFWQFKSKLKDHRKQSLEASMKSFEEELLFQQDLEMWNKSGLSLYNSRGELRFAMTEAKKLLRDDIRRGLHKNLTPKEFQATRKAYHPFLAKKFKERVYQEERYQRFENWQSDKRIEKVKQLWEKEKERKEKEKAEKEKEEKAKKEKAERERMRAQEKRKKAKEKAERARKRVEERKRKVVNERTGDWPTEEQLAAYKRQRTS